MNDIKELINSEKLHELFEKYKYIILILVILVALLLIRFFLISEQTVTEVIKDEKPRSVFDDSIIYYINLDRATRRRYYIENMFRKNDIVANRISAVDAQLIDIDDVKYKKYFKPHPEGLWHVSAYDYYKQDPKHKGHFGAFLSHMKTFEIFLKTNKKYAIIFEDDMEMEDFKPIVNAHYGYIPDDWDMILLSYNISHEQGDAGKFQLENNILKINGNFTSMGAYIIKRDAVKMLLRELEDHTWLIDWKIGDLALEGRFNVYGIYPPFVCQPAQKFIHIKSLGIDYKGSCSTEMGGMFVTNSE